MTQSPQTRQATDAHGPLLLDHPSEHVAVLTLNRSASRNSIDTELATLIDEAVAQIEANNQVRVAIITGAGDRAFCAGADLKQVADGRLDDLFTTTGGFAGFVNAPRKKPWIAAVNGFALAGGLEIALACDMVIACDTAQFGLPEVTRGLIASAGGLYRLPRALPKVVALEMISTGAPIGAERAHQLGLINAVTSSSTLMPTALALADQIGANAPLAVRESLAIARAAASFDDPNLRRYGDEAQQRLQQTADYVEGSRAFVEKRPPIWLAR